MTASTVADAAALPAPAVTQAASAVTNQSATVSGVLDTEGQTAYYTFEYGPSTAYSHFTSSTTIHGGQGFQTVEAKLSGLIPNTTYHYQLVSSVPYGEFSNQFPLITVSGGDKTFTTAKAGDLVISAKRFSVNGAYATVPVRCASTLRCSGTVTFSDTVAFRGTKTVVPLGSTNFTVSPQKSAKLKIKLIRTALKALAAARTHSIKTNLAATLPSTGQIGVKKPVTLFQASPTRT